MAIPITPHGRLTYDEETRAVRSWFDTSVAPAEVAPVDPVELARRALSESAGLFRWNAELEDLRDLRLIEGEAFSVRFTQEFKEIPVDDSEIVVDIMRDGRVYSIYNNYHYDVPDVLDPAQAKVTKRRATQLVQRLFRGFEGVEPGAPELIIYQYHPSQNRPPKPMDKDEELRSELASAIGSDPTGEGIRAARRKAST